MSEREAEIDKWTWEIDEDAIIEAAASIRTSHAHVECRADDEDMKEGMEEKKKEVKKPTSESVYDRIREDDSGDEIAADIVALIRNNDETDGWVREAVRSMSETQSVQALRALAKGVMPGMVFDSQNDDGKAVKRILDMIMSTHKSDLLIKKECAEVLKSLDECRYGLEFVDSVGSEVLSAMETVSDPKTACSILLGLVKCLVKQLRDSQVSDDPVNVRRRGVQLIQVINSVERKLKPILSSGQTTYVSALTGIMKDIQDSFQQLTTLNATSPMRLVAQNQVNTASLRVNRLLSQATQQL